MFWHGWGSKITAGKVGNQQGIACRYIIRKPRVRARRALAWCPVPQNCKNSSRQRLNLKSVALRGCAVTRARRSGGRLGDWQGSVKNGLPSAEPVVQTKENALAANGAAKRIRQERGGGGRTACNQNGGVNLTRKPETKVAGVPRRVAQSTIRLTARRQQHARPRAQRRRTRHKQRAAAQNVARV